VFTVASFEEYAIQDRIKDLEDHLVDLITFSKKYQTNSLYVEEVKRDAIAQIKQSIINLNHLLKNYSIGVGNEGSFLVCTEVFSKN